MALPEDLTSQLEDVQKKINELKTNDSAETRYALHVAAKELSQATEDPMDVFFEEVILASVTPTVIVTAVKIGLFKQLVFESGPVTAEQLAQATGCSVDLVVRIMRVLAARKMVLESRLRTYEANEITKVLARDDVTQYMKRVHNLRAEACLHLPAWVEANGFSTQMHRTDSPFVSRHQKNLWELLDHNADDQKAFENYMDIVYSPELTQKTAEFIQKTVISDMQNGSDGVALVDIGGSSGALAKTLSQLASTSGRIITQDRNRISIDQEAYPNVESMEFDFFTPQLVNGARAYSLRHVLHDWSDSDCTKILQSTVSGMKQNWSSLFIFETILPMVNCDFPSAIVDIIMLSETGGRERTLEDWKTLLLTADLEIVSTTLIDETGNEWAIEARRK